MSMKRGLLFLRSFNLKTMLGRIYAYLFKEFSFNAKVFDYEEYWDRLSKETYRPISSFKFKLIEEIIDEGSRVLDIGCGDGALLHYLRKAKGIEAHGIETSEKATELAREKTIKVKKADITQEEFQLKETYDYIILSEVLEHLPNPERLLSILRGKFSKYIIITIPNTGFAGERLRLLLGRFPKQWVVHPSEHLRFWTVTDFIFWCEQLGFRVEKYYGLFDEFYDIKIKLWKYYPKFFARYILYKVTE